MMREFVAIFSVEKSAWTSMPLAIPLFQLAVTPQVPEAEPLARLVHAVVLEGTLNGTAVICKSMVLFALLLTSVAAIPAGSVPSVGIVPESEPV